MKIKLRFLACMAALAVLGVSCGEEDKNETPSVVPQAVTSLTYPLDGDTFDVSKSSSLNFQWGKVSSKSAAVTYELLFDRPEGSFTDPLASFASASSGKAPYLIVPAADLEEIASKAGIQDGGSVRVKWTVSASCGAEAVLSTQSRELVLNKGKAKEQWSWAMAADSCTFILLNSFMNEERGVWWKSRNNIAGDNSNNYWGQAYPWQTVLYSYDRIKNGNPALANKYHELFKKWVSNNGNNYNGVKKNGFYCQYTDDMAWIALVFLHAYESFGTEDYLTKATEIFDYMTESQRVVELGEKVWTGSKDSPVYKINDEGWGLIWRTGNEDTLDGLKKDTRNACTNTPAMIIACELYRHTQKQDYLDKAVKIYDLMTKTGNRVNDKGRVGDPPLTYTQGCWIEGCRLLYHLTGDVKYRESSTTCVNFTMTGGRCTNADGILRSEGTDGDQRNFKGGLMPYMINYILDTQMPLEMRTTAKAFMTKNATTLWMEHMDRSEYPYMFANYVFSQFYNEDKVINGVTYHNLGWCGMHNCGAALLEGMARLEL